MKITGSFALIVTWPDIHNAEYEVILRIQRAAKKSGKKCILINNEGYILSSLSANQPRRIRSVDVEFALSLHFESPKLFDVYTYTALWNPMEFYEDWGYEKSLMNLISHDDFVYSGSPQAWRQILRLRHSFPRLPADAVEFYPSISDPVFPPTLGNQKLFYCGMNWEKINNQQGRHHDLLRLLDDSGALAIYGPRDFMGVKVWEDYQSYVGPIPFDGWSLIREINKCGICLVLMSDAHYHSGIASSRIYEGLAAGALIITDDHQFFRSRFGDTVLYITPLSSGRKRFEQIAEHLLWIEKNPDAVIAKAAAAQKIYLKHFTMDKLLDNIFVATETRRVANRVFVSASQRNDIIEVIIPFVAGPVAILSDILKTLAEQSYKNIHYTLLLDEGFSAEMSMDISDIVPSTLIGRISTLPFYDSGDEGFSSGPRLLRTGDAVARALQTSKAPYFCFITAVDVWFSDHLDKLKRVLDNEETTFAAYSGAIIEQPVTSSFESRSLDFLQFDKLDRQAMDRLHRHPGLFLFRSSLYDDETNLALADLDGLEHLLFAAVAARRGGLKGSTSATCVHRLANERFTPLPVLSIGLQQNFLEDFGLLDRAQPTSASPYAPDGELLLNPLTRKTRSFQRGIQPYQHDSLVVFGKRGNYGQFASKGWSQPEDSWVWINGVNAQIIMRPELVEPEGGYFLRFDMEPLVVDSMSQQSVSISVNGRIVVTVKYSVKARSILSCPIPKGLIRAGEPLAIDIECENAYRPPGETRYLSLRLFSILLKAQSKKSKLQVHQLNADFDEKIYLSNYPDVLAAVENGDLLSAYDHFIRFGIDEGRSPCQLDGLDKQLELNC